MHIPILSNGGRPQRERGQALVEYALITVLVGLVFGLGLAATAPAIGTAFGRIVDDVLRQTEIADADAPGSIGFWATVTEVFNLTPSGGGLPPNTVVPTPVFTGGPTLTPSQTYTPTPLTPSPTPRPTRTPFDQEKAAPFRDTVDEAAWWRIDSNINLRGSPWTVELFDNTTLSGTAARSLPGFLNIDQTGTFATGFPSAASEGQNFSARIRRTIELLDDPNTPQADQQPLKFRILADDGVRLSVNGTPVSLRDINGSTNSWVNQGSPMLWMGSLVLAPGTHTIVVEYYHTTGTPRLKIEVTGGGANPDDAPATAGSAFICNWGILTNANNANSEANQFDDYVDGVSGTNTTCYLEWRGSVVVPDTMTAPQLVFWDVWDLPTGSEVWVEVAEYIPVDPTLPIKSANRSAMTWQRVNLAHTTGGTANYNWTRNVIDLNPLMTAFGSPKRVAFRFALRTGGTVNTRTKWHIDDIEFRDGSSTVITANRTWTFDNPDERFEFIVNAPRSNPGIESGWALVTNNRFGTSGFAWHDSVNTVVDDPNIVAGGSGGNTNPFTRYKRHTDSLQSDALNNVRVHALEFNGFINLASVPNPDAQGNTGVPVLSFYHAFDLGGRTGLVVQYTTSPYSTSPANWITLPGGVLRDITQTNNASSLTMQEVNIPLNAIPGNPAQVRLRFAMLVRPDATPRDGWWIDSIRLGRASAPRWLNYPFFDDAQVNGPQLFWVYGGQWQVASNIGYRGLATTGNPADARSYASSPNSNYANNQTTAITMRWPIDLYNDTPSKQVIEDGSGDLITSNSSGAPATSTSELTFYHRRVIAATDQFRVEWKRASEADTSWRPLWSYRRGMQTNPSTTNDRTARNDAWEFTRVSLYPIFRQFTLDGNGLPGVGTGTALTDDDIVFRFTIVADNNSNARGVYVDDIRIQERVNREIKLWPTGEVRVNPANTSQSVGIGTARNVTIDPDFISTGDDWRTFFRFSGDWNAISFESRQGVLSLHDSVVGGQDRAPTGFRNTATNSDDTGDGAWRTRNYSFTTLEMQPVIDLRGVNAQTEAPRLTFWTRMHLARYDWAYVQVSLEDTRSETDINNSMNARCGNPTPALLQCYEQERGWGSWQTIWSIGTDSDDNGTRAYGWQYMSVDLSPFAYQPSTNTAGRRIRLRFVIDSLTDNTNADGFYLDDIQLEHRLPTPVGMSTVINQGSFVDPSRNLNNWIGEGLWNLDTAVFQGGGGGPVSLGVWNVRWWNCGGCSNL
ncbi:MAG: hypothetical protein MUC99_01080, partial [Anaerolineae bacterium]|nr:hypothetical protein [Anaerolineae bacterium]